MPIVILLLIYTLTVETRIGGVTANRWIEIPLVGVNFPDFYVGSCGVDDLDCQILDENQGNKNHFQRKYSTIVVARCIGGTIDFARKLFNRCHHLFDGIGIVFLGGYPLKYLFAMVATGIVFAGMFLFVLFKAPEVLPQRAGTWKSRIETFIHPEQADKDDLHQLTLAQIAVAEGGVVGKGAGKSVMKNMLSQSTSDFIFAIIIEEYGLLGGGALLFFYLLLLFRIVVVAHSSKTVFSKLLVIGLDCLLCFQAFINMAVVVQLFPVTGQPLPSISMGGTSIWMTCMAIGIVLSASNKKKIWRSNPME